ncbi:HAMP domain-containing sensor histidine kinase [Cellulomonas sp. NTE-D12]|uniref:sensor histidine kinase n=1 Tax=Cellulomonas sp. NTE-D12 TaxID=2962632 RepID=UPI003081EA1D|nr:two-component sensor histidine kinase [Cellulomonas sp. NTE-D12]
MRRLRLPIAARIALAAGLLAAVLLTAGAFAVRAAIHAAQLRSTQQLATVEATQITDAIGTGVHLYGLFGSLPYQLVRNDGAVIAVAPEAENAVVPPPSTESPQTAGEVWHVDPATAAGARVAVSSTLRASSMTGVADEDLPGGAADRSTTVYRAYVFVTPAAANRVVASLDPFLWGGVVLAVALIAVTAATATRRALRPVEQMRVVADGIAGAPDGARLTEPEAPDELRALATTLNAMLTRIDDATVRQQRFIADAAHELRSPLAALLAAIEVGRAHPDALPPERTLASVETQARRLADLAEELLDLASATGAAQDSGEVCDAAEVVRDVVAGRTLRVPVDVSAPETAPVRIAAGALARIVGNLLDNAVRHAATRVDIAVTVDDAVHIVVTNDGEPVSAADAERIFEPFVRLDASRSRDTGSTGLGLTISRELVTRAGGTVELSRISPTTFTVQLPLAQDG